MKVALFFGTQMEVNQPVRAVVRTGMMPIKLMREILDAAGKRIGLGDFRPARKGPFGKFTVTHWTERTAKAAA